MTSLGLGKPNSRRIGLFVGSYDVTVHHTSTRNTDLPDDLLHILSKTPAFSLINQPSGLLFHSLYPERSGHAEQKFIISFRVRTTSSVQVRVNERLP